MVVHKDSIWQLLSCVEWNNKNIYFIYENKKIVKFDNSVVINGTVSCHNNNLQCQQWWRSCQLVKWHHLEPGLYPNHEMESVWVSKIIKYKYLQILVCFI